MKKILFFISILGLAGCANYTLQNDSSEAVKTGSGKTVEPGMCEEDIGSGGLMGDFPMKITKPDDSKLNDANEAEYPAGHYVVNADGTISKAEEACEKTTDPSAKPKPDGEKGSEPEDPPAEVTPSTGGADAEKAPTPTPSAPEATPTSTPTATPAPTQTYGGGGPGRRSH